MLIEQCDLRERIPKVNNELLLHLPFKKKKKKITPAFET